MTGEDVVTTEAGARQVGRLKVHADTLRSAVGKMEGAVKPPGAVVVPQVMVWSSGLLAAGNNRGCDRVHGDVVVLVHDTAMPGKTERPS